MRPLRHGGSHFVNAFWHGNQDDSDVHLIYIAEQILTAHCKVAQKTNVSQILIFYHEIMCDLIYIYAVSMAWTSLAMSLYDCFLFNVLRFELCMWH